jgi:hypothetical protein
MIVGQRGITTLSLVASRDDSFMRDFDVVSTHDARWGGCDPGRAELLWVPREF